MAYKIVVQANARAMGNANLSATIGGWQISMLCSCRRRRHPNMANPRVDDDNRRDDDQYDVIYYRHDGGQDYDGANSDDDYEHDDGQDSDDYKHDGGNSDDYQRSDDYDEDSDPTNSERERGYEEMLACHDRLQRQWPRGDLRRR